MNLTIITNLVVALIAGAGTWAFQDARMDAAVAKLNATHAAQESERHRVALDDARDTFRKGEIHASNQQEIIDAHAKQERARAAALAAAAADGERLRKQVAEYAATCGGEKPKAQPLPSSIAGIEPPPSGFYTEKLTARRKRSQELLNSTPMKSAP